MQFKPTLAAKEDQTLYRNKLITAIKLSYIVLRDTKLVRIKKTTTSAETFLTQY